MLLTVLWMLVVVMAGVTAYVVRHLAGLPYAPECPSCHCVTAQPVRTSRMDRLAARIVGADPRLCPRCGWSGRMRWRLAAERARRE